MKEKVIIQQIAIGKKAELKAFQLKLPPDAKRIIGFEVYATGMSLPDVPSFSVLPDDLFLFQHTQIAGDVRIQSCGKTNLFYSAHVAFSDRNIAYGDFSQNNLWIDRVWTTGYKKEEDIVQVMDCCPVLLGIYRDKLGELQNADLSYKVNLYLWYSIE